MFVLKQFLKQFILPPVSWLLPLLVVLIFWRRRWARKFFFAAFCLIIVLHSNLVSYGLRQPLESRYPPVLDPAQTEPYDAIVVLTSASIPATGLIPFPTIDVAMFRRLEEAWRLYRMRRKPIIVSGGHVNPFTPAQDENQIARDYLIQWGVPAEDVIGEERSRDTFESAVEVQKLVKQKGWRRYLLVTSAMHMPRSMLVFSERVPEPIPAPGDFTIGQFELTPFDFFPNEGVAPKMFATIHEYAGLVNYYWRLRFSNS